MGWGGENSFESEWSVVWRKPLQGVMQLMWMDVSYGFHLDIRSYLEFIFGVVKSHIRSRGVP